MTSSKKLCVLLPILLVAVVIANQASAVENRRQLQTLVEKYFVPDFRGGGLVQKGRTQFAIVAFLPNTQWMEFLYTPSENRDGQKPYIDPDSSLSPPDENKAWYNNYLAARPNNGVHSETQILNRLDNLYNQYKGKHKGSPPQAMLLYSWIVPCISCTDNLVAKLTSEPYKSIRTKVVAYTTLGTKTKCKCDVNYTIKQFQKTGVELVRIRMRKEEMEDLIAQLMLE